MKWVKASDRLPEDHWQGKFRNINDNSLKEYNGIHEKEKGRFSTGSLIIASRNVEWLDESENSFSEEDLIKEAEHLFPYNEAIVNAGIDEINELLKQLVDRRRRDWYNGYKAAIQSSLKK